jgi:hypothetical protein
MHEQRIVAVPYIYSYISIQFKFPQYTLRTTVWTAHCSSTVHLQLYFHSVHNSPNALSVQLYEQRTVAVRYIYSYISIQFTIPPIQCQYNSMNSAL